MDDKLTNIFLTHHSHWRVTDSFYLCFFPLSSGRSLNPEAEIKNTQFVCLLKYPLNVSISYMSLPFKNPLGTQETTLCLPDLPAIALIYTMKTNKSLPKSKILLTEGSWAAQSYVTWYWIHPPARTVLLAEQLYTGLINKSPRQKVLRAGLWYKDAFAVLSCFVLYIHSFSYIFYCRYSEEYHVGETWQMCK